MDKFFLYCFCVWVFEVCCFYIVCLGIFYVVKGLVMFFCEVVVSFRRYYICFLLLVKMFKLILGWDKIFVFVVNFDIIMIVFINK